MSKVEITGEGYIKYDLHGVKNAEENDTLPKQHIEKGRDYPEIMNVSHVAEILGVSHRVAYEIMDLNDFPLIRIRRSKRVSRNELFEWLKRQSIR